MPPSRNSRLAQTRTQPSAAAAAAVASLLPGGYSSFSLRQRHQLAAVAVPPSSSDSTLILSPHLAINENFPGLKLVHAHPNIYIIENFLDASACDDLMEQARRKGDMAQSPVAYAGWTQDFVDLFELAAKGPVAWLSLIGAWWQLQQPAEQDTASQLALVQHAVQNYFILLVIATAAIAAFTKSREAGLQALRTSTSTTLDDLQTSVGARQFVQATARLFCEEQENDSNNSRRLRQKEAASYFEAPTIIRYEAGQQLAPHFDANRSASTEDANRGGQTLATLLVYLNDVPKGGLTKFGRLRQSKTSDSKNNSNHDIFSVQPKRGDALLFFPADAAGRFDERTEHEGCPAIDEKWIARIWRHQGQVPPPFGLSETELSRLELMD